MFPPQVNIAHGNGHFDFYPSSGMIRCNRHTGMDWCLDRAELIQGRLDQHFLWGFDTLQEEMLEIKLVCPIFPTQNIWTPLLITGQYEHRMFRVDIDTEASGGQLPPGMADSYVCTITPGEGINDIRSTLIEMIRMTDFQTNECKASHHGVIAQTVWDQKRMLLPTNKNIMYPDWYCIWLTGWCIYCRDHSSIVTDPDLIPPSQGTVWNK